MPRRRDPRTDRPTPGGPGSAEPRPPIGDQPSRPGRGPTLPGGGTIADPIVVDPILDPGIVDPIVVDPIVVDPIVVDPILDPGIVEQLRGEAKPLLLLPLRIEYRVGTDARGRPNEIRFRWFPDDGFAEEGIAPADDAEQAALAEVRDRLDGRDWWDVDDEEVVAAFSGFAHEVGAERAVHLLRHGGDGDDAHEERIGRIAALPGSVTLFGVTGEEITTIGKGADVDPSFGYTVDLLEQDHWFLDFDAVVEAGMGLRVTDADDLRAALDAEWVIAVGLHRGDAGTEIRSLLTDGIANGTFAFLRQDVATNNGDGTASRELSPLRDLRRFHREATELERGLHHESSKQASDLLAEALGIDPEVVEPAARSADLALEDARAMVRVVLPALLEQLPDQATELGAVDTDDLIDFFASWISARGNLPAVRFGDEPYGVLPVTRIADLQPLPDDDEADQAIGRFLQTYAHAAGRSLARQAATSVPVIEPGDVEAATALEASLKVSAVSRRIDVEATDGEGSRPVGCPYVSHADHDPADYLEQLRTTALADLPDPTADDRSTPLLYRLARRSASRRIARLGQLVQIGADSRVSGRIDTVLENLGESDLHVEAGIRADATVVPADDADSDDPRGEPASPGAGRLEATNLPKLSRRLLQRAESEGRRFEAVIDRTQALDSVTSLQGSSIEAIADQGSLAGFDRGIAGRLEWFTRGFGDALRHLRTVAAREDGTAQLESLLFETVDLVQHRVDAWAAGLAYRRLVARRRRAELEGLRGGYYGMIGRLRPASTTGSTDGYLQAPSPEQATTAAVLRAAHLRFRDEGAFDVDLSSSRVRRATGLYGLVQRGLSLEEILGISGERWLHDERLDRLIRDLRERFPMRDPDDDDQVEIRLFDGRAFLDADVSDLTSDRGDRSHLGRLQDTLSDDLDALADLVMAEAVHQRVQGNADAAHAWLQVLSGDRGPSEPSFQRTHRKGHTSSHAVMLLVPGADPRSGATPREVAEPSLSAMVDAALPSLDDARVAVAVLDDGGEPVGGEVELALIEDLGVTAWDLVVGGIDELKLRAVVAFLRRWQTDEEMQGALGPAPTSLRALTSSRSTQVRLGDGPGSVTALLDRALAIRRGISRGRALQVTDLHAAAPATEQLTEVDTVDRLSGAAAHLRRRAELLEAHLTDLHGRLTRKLDAALVHARNLRRARQGGASPGDVGDEAAELRPAAAALHEVLVEVSRTAEPRALLMTASTALRDDPDRVEEDGLAVLDHLDAERRGLRAALADAASDPGTASEARKAVRLLTEALKGALDGDALPVVATLEPRGSTRPVLDDGGTAREELQPWADARAGVRHALALADAAVLEMFLVGEAATTDDLEDEDRDPRDESVAPRSRFHGRVLSSAADPAARGSLAGIVIDEWSEAAPSSEQTTGLAINYDTPRNEAPNAVLLCEPPSTDVRTWSVERAAGMVVETLRWMKSRALTTEVAAASGPLLAGCNQVAMQGAGDDASARVPWQPLLMEILPVDIGDAEFILSDQIQATALNEAMSRRKR